MPEMQQSVLVVGVGSIGERHVRCFAHTGRARLWICEPNEELRRHVADAYPVDRAEASLESFHDSLPDAAVICTPAPLHIPLARKLAARGVHLLIEKPLSLTTEGIHDLAREASRHRLTVAVAYVLRNHPALAGMREALYGGRFGRPRQVVFQSGQHFPFYRPAYREIYYASHASGGGAIQDALTHGVNAVEWLVGPLTSLVADAAHQLLADVQVEDTVHVLGRHSDVLASYSLNQFQAPNETTWTVVCERATLRCCLHRAEWEWQSQPDGHWHSGGKFRLERDDLFTAQAHGFLNAVEHAQPVGCSLAEGLQTVKVTQAILRSVEQQQWQTIVPEEI